MESTKQETYLTIKEEFSKSLISKYQTYKMVSYASKIELKEVTKIFKNNKVKLEHAKILCELMNVEFDEGFSKTTIFLEREPTHTQLSEQMINGFKANIVKRLSVTHSKMFIDEIIKVVDDIIEESCYLGIECQKLGKTDFIKKKIYKRRRNE